MSDEDKEINPDTQGIDLSSGDWILNEKTGEIMEVSEILKDTTNFMDIPYSVAKNYLNTVLSNRKQRLILGLLLIRHLVKLALKEKDVNFACEY